MFEGYTVTISEDGRFISGHKERKPAPEPVIEEVIMAVPDEAADTKFNGILARLAESCASDYEAKADFYVKKANALDEEIDETEMKNQKLRNRIKLWEKLAIPFAIVSGIVGAFLGTLVAISNLLANHGPTVTVFGTLGACGLYALCGITIGAFMSVLGYGAIASWENDDKIKLRENKSLIEDKKKQQAECLAKIKTYEALAKNQLHMSWELRCKEIM